MNNFDGVKHEINLAKKLAVSSPELNVRQNEGNLGIVEKKLFIDYIISVKRDPSLPLPTLCVECLYFIVE